MSLSKFLTIKTKLATIFDLLYIPDNVCLDCGSSFRPKIQGYICENCIKAIKPTIFEKTKIDYVDSYRIFGDYEGALKHMILALKFKKASIFANIIAEIIKEDFEDFTIRQKPDIITFVPISFLRFWRRGYNQNFIILKSLNIDVEDTLKRIKHSKPLSLIKDKQKRYETVISAFDIRKDFKFGLDDKSILVFDDVVTTGFTASSIAKLFKKHGAREVYFYFVASERHHVVMNI